MRTGSWSCGVKRATGRRRKPSGAWGRGGSGGEEREGPFPLGLSCVAQAHSNNSRVKLSRPDQVLRIEGPPHLSRLNDLESARNLLAFPGFCVKAKIRHQRANRKRRIELWRAGFQQSTSFFCLRPPKAKEKIRVR